MRRPARRTLHSITLGAFLALAAVLPAHAQGTPTLAHARREFDAGNFDAAKPEFTQLARANPKDPTPLLYLGKIALAQNDIDEGVKQFERCVDVDDANADCHAWLGNAVGSAAQTANKLRLPFLAKRTKKEFDRAVELDPANLEGRWGQLQYFMQAPGFLGGSMDKARATAAEIERRFPLRGAYAHGMLADHAHDVPAAETAYQRAITVAPDSMLGYTGLVNLYLREKRWSDAFGVIDRVSARLPQNKDVLLATAAVALVSGEQLARGEEAAKKWIADPPKDAGVAVQSAAHFRLGRIYQATARRELARQEYAKAVQINPRNDAAKKALNDLK